MPKSRLSAFLSLMIVFLSGALVGAFANRLYMVNTVSAVKQPKQGPHMTPEEFRKHQVEDLRQKVGLDDQQIAQYNAKGIAVDYLFYPLSIHPGADKKAEAVWCSQDRPNAFTAAMAGKDPGKANCPNPVGELTELAKNLGIGGTPTVLADDGTQISSSIAMSPDRLAAELDRLSAAAHN